MFRAEAYMYSRSGSPGRGCLLFCTGASERSSLIRCKTRGMALVQYKLFILCCLEQWGERLDFPSQVGEPEKIDLSDQAQQLLFLGSGIPALPTFLFSWGREPRGMFDYIV